jgi:hypothetical protein
MHPRKLAFLTGVLGSDGALALAKASERSEVFAHAIVPRTILAWLASEPAYEGPLPGVGDTYIAFTKNESAFSGSVTVGKELYRFENETVFHVAASIAVALGVEKERIDPGMRNVDIQRLGKTIDLFAKTRMVKRELNKAFCPGCISKKAEHVESCTKRKELEKGQEGPGLTAAPTAPEAPTPPTPAGGTPPKSATVVKPPKPPGAKSATVKFTRSEATHRCAACGIAQFKNERILGCMCLRDLCKSARVVATDAETLTVEFKDLDRESLVTIYEAVGRK